MIPEQAFDSDNNEYGVGSAEPEAYGCAMALDADILSNNASVGVSAQDQNATTSSSLRVSDRQVYAKRSSVSGALDYSKRATELHYPGMQAT